MKEINPGIATFYIESITSELNYFVFPEGKFRNCSS